MREYVNERLDALYSLILPGELQAARPNSDVPSLTLANSQSLPPLPLPL